MRRTALALTVLLAFSGPLHAAETVAPAPVVFHQQGHGWVLSDEKGMTLYTSLRDEEPGKSTCNGPCAQLWPPLEAAQGSKPDGEWSLVAREDGKTQWAYRGKPLYRYSRDVSPGDANGDDVGNQWRVAFKPIPTPPGIGISRTLLGYVLADAKNLTLYSYDKDKADGSGCDLTCTRQWMPFPAPAMAHATADWTVVTRRDGTKQWAFRGKPVYRYSGDFRPSETSGEGKAAGWHAVVLEPPPPNPPWVTIQESDAGELLANAKGQTLYTFNTARRGIAIKTDIDKPEDWVPVMAEADAQRIGNWSLIDRPQGGKQWAYKGLILYTNVNDTMPGDILGVRSGDRRFQAIMRSGLPMQGTGN